MAEEQTTPRTMTDLRRRVDRDWTRLNEAIGRLSEAQVTAPGADGWSIKDHLAHLTAWERSVLGLLRGQPRHEVMGLDEATYEAGFDQANAVIQRRSQARPLDEVMADFQTTHAEVLTMLGDLTDADLLKPYSYFQPNSSGEHSGEPVIGWIINNTYGHYQEHIDYIERLASAAS
jgi:uncharacterized protein (TIGR03083 family)